MEKEVVQKIFKQNTVGSKKSYIAERLCDSILHFLVIITKLGMLLCYMNEMNIGYGATQNFQICTYGGHF